jgi:copper resistance protein B
MSARENLASAVFFALSLAAANSTNAAEAPRHVPPDPPSHLMPPMSNEEMTEIMGMDDTTRYGRATFDELEWRADHLDTLAWIRPVGAWWSLQAGLRVDDGSYSSHEGPTRTWAAIGLSGLAPYRVEVDAMLYVGESGRAALRLDLDYELVITQRWVLRPHAELHFYAEDDPERDIGSGLADAELGLRLHYEIRRELAPYVGVLWSRRVGETEDRTSARGVDPRELQFVAGVHVWF